MTPKAAPLKNEEVAGDAPPHVVQFYDDDDLLEDAVVDFLAVGLAVDAPAIVIATAAHRRGFCEKLAALGFDTERLVQTGWLVMLDADETLARFMVGSSPDRGLFKQTVGPLLERATAEGRGRQLRAYGEMVDLLWRGGNRRAALLLEEMWNDLQKSWSFVLLCSYFMPSFHEASGGLREVCGAHSHVDVSRLQERGRRHHPANDVRVLAAEIQYRKELERELRQSVRELRQHEEQLQETVRFNEMFTAILGHDLRNPLAAMITSARLAMARDGSERLQKPLGRILSSGARMTRMIDQLLDLTRVRLGGGIPLAPTELDIVPLIRQVIDELDEANPDWTLRATSLGETSGRWDRDRLSQLFSNLVANAVQHGVREAGVDVTIDGRGADDVRVAVRNMGAIPASRLPTLFQPLAGTERQLGKSGGLGLGLFITHELVRVHGGSIDVRSDDTQGTTFTVVLPRGGATTGAKTSETTRQTSARATTSPSAPAVSHPTTVAAR